MENEIKNEEPVIEVVHEEIHDEVKKEELKENNKENKSNNKKTKILVIVIAIILVAVAGGIGWFLGTSLADKEESLNEEKNEGTDKKEETEEKSDSNKIIDEEEAPNPTVVKTSENVSPTKTTTVKPDYGIDANESFFYKDGYLGYYEEVDSNIEEGIYPDAPIRDFVKLYECTNKEYGKCGIIETLGSNGDYNLEESIKIAANESILYDDRYMFIYDGNVYYESYMPQYLSTESPLIIYDTVTKKVLGKYLAVYDSYTNDDYYVFIDLNGNYGVISLCNGNLKEVIAFKYDYIGRLYEKSNFMVVKDGQYYIYNPSTAKKVGPFNNQIANYSEKYIITNEGSYNNNTEKNYRLYSIDGKKILTDSGYEYMEIAGDYVIAVDSNKTLNVYDSNGKPILNKSIDKLYGTYHVRCCGALMLYSYEINNNTMDLYVNRDMKGNEVVETYRYKIDLKNKTYTSELYISEE